MSNQFALTVATAAVVVATSGVCLAQDAGASTMRSQVRDETRAAQRAKQLTPAGEGVTPAPAATSPSTKTRAQRKAETLQARADGNLLPAGPAGFVKNERASAATRSTKTRAERKAEALAAAKAGKLTPAGEGTAPTR